MVGAEHLFLEGRDLKIPRRIPNGPFIPQFQPIENFRRRVLSHAVSGQGELERKRLRDLVAKDDGALLVQRHGHLQTGLCFFTCIPGGYSDEALRSHDPRFPEGFPQPGGDDPLPYRRVDEDILRKVDSDVGDPFLSRTRGKEEKVPGLKGIERDLRQDRRLGLSGRLMGEVDSESLTVDQFDEAGTIEPFGVAPPPLVRRSKIALHRILKVLCRAWKP